MSPRRSTRPLTAEEEQRLGWREWIGVGPERVLVFENLQRQRTLYLRWWDEARSNWAVRSLRRALRDAQGRQLVGRALEEAKREARAEADAQYLRNKGKEPPPAEDLAAPAAPAPFTVGEAERVLTAPDGPFPTPSPYRTDILRELRWAVTVWGAAMPWEELRHRHFVQLWRQRFETLRQAGHAGHVGAQQTIVRVLAVVRFLREYDETLIPPSAALIQPDWRRKLAADYETLYGAAVPTPHRPRYTMEETRALLDVAGDVDPRLWLLLVLGAEQRSGQVLRARRSWLTLPPVDWPLARRDPTAFLAQAFGTLAIESRGKKGGAVVDLTPGQRWAVERALDPRPESLGYLGRLEAGYRTGRWTDFPLFPAGRLVGFKRRAGDVPHAAEHRHAAAPVDDATARGWLHDAEARAKIPSVLGRAFYGARRRGVDDATDAGISAGALQAFGGWSRIETPLAIYREQERAQDRREAREVRARIRGESLDTLVAAIEADYAIDAAAVAGPRADPEQRAQDVSTDATTPEGAVAPGEEVSSAHSLTDAGGSMLRHTYGPCIGPSENLSAGTLRTLPSEDSPARAEAARPDAPKEARFGSVRRKQFVSSEPAPAGSVGGVASALGASFGITAAGRDALATEPVVDDVDDADVGEGL